MNDKALIIFARHPEPGKVKTRLTPALSPRQAARLYHFMLTDIINGTGTLSGIDRLLFYSGGENAERYFHELCPGLPLFPQKGPDLGSRMEHAFSHVFALGYRSAAVIGTDSPDLPVYFIIDAFRLLEEGTEVVFGPAEDGGYYLLALKEVHGELFRGIAWSSGHVLRQSMEKARSKDLRTSELPLWHDVDTFEDLARVGKRAGAGFAPLTVGFIDNPGLRECGEW